MDRFAARDPDHRLLQLVDTYSEPGEVRVLDLGCAAGRNAVLLAERGFDVTALDSSEAMVLRTRQRLEHVLGRAEAGRRVRRGDMEDLGRFADASFDLVVALGIYHQAATPVVWKRALAETARVLRPEGLLLVATFSPESAPEGRPMRPIPRQLHMYHGFRSGPLYLVGVAELERALATEGLVPVAKTETVRVEMEGGWRVTVNGLFRRDVLPDRVPAR